MKRWEHWTAFQYLKEAYKKDWDKVFIRIRCCGKISSGFKIKEGRFRLNIKHYFMMRIVKHWNMFPREVADVPSLELFKVDGWGS